MKRSVLISLYSILFVVFGEVNLTYLDSSKQSENNNTVSVSKFRKTRLSLEIPDDELLLFNKLRVKRYEEDPGRQESRGCSCDQGLCKCCTGYFLDLLNQKACMNVRYHPGDFAFDVAMTFNNRVLYESTMSGKNPRPVCVSPPRLNNLKMCAQFSNVFFPGRNFHFCLDFIGKWGSNQLFDISFNCLRMGANGIAMVKPEDSGGLPIVSPQGGVDADVDAGEDDIDDYDENLVKSLFGFLDR